MPLLKVNYSVIKVQENKNENVIQGDLLEGGKLYSNRWPEHRFMLQQAWIVLGVVSQPEK